MNKWVVVCDMCKKEVSETARPHYEIMVKRFIVGEHGRQQNENARVVDACYQCAETHFHALVK